MQKKLSKSTHKRLAEKTRDYWKSRTTDKNNIDRIRNALIEFGYGSESLPGELFINEKNVITLGVEPNRIDLINNIDGVAFEEARACSEKGRYGKYEVMFIGLKDLIRNKISTKRTKDKADAEELILFIKKPSYSSPPSC